MATRRRPRARLRDVRDERGRAGSVPPELPAFAGGGAGDARRGDGVVFVVEGAAAAPVADPVRGAGRARGAERGAEGRDGGVAQARGGGGAGVRRVLKGAWVRCTR